MTHDASVQSHRFHWNLTFGTPLFKEHLHSGDKNFGPWMLTFLSLHLLPFFKGTPPRGGGGGGHTRDVWVEVCRQSLQNLRTLSKTNRPSIALFFFDNLQRYPEGNSLVKTLQLRKSPQCSGFFSRRHVSDQCDSREMILHYDKRENMIRAISDTDRTTSQDTQISFEIYMCVVEFFTSQKCLIWKEPFRWVNNSLLITVLIRISAQPRISVHLE